MVTEEIKRYLKTTENETITIQNLWDIANAVLRGTFIAYKLTSGNKENLKQPKLIPKTLYKEQQQQKKKPSKLVKEKKA